MAVAPLGGAFPGHSCPCFPACGMGGQLYLDGRARVIYPDCSMTLLPLSTDCLYFFISAVADNLCSTVHEPSVRGCWTSWVLKHQVSYHLKEVGQSAAPLPLPYLSLLCSYCFHPSSHPTHSFTWRWWIHYGPFWFWKWGRMAFDVGKSYLDLLLS